MKKIILLLFTGFLPIFPSAKAQLTPDSAIMMMQRGINIGNSLDATPGETSWGNPLIQAYYFDDYRNTGFTSVRIPVTWKYHVSTVSPYTIDAAWLNRVDSVVTWALRRGLIVILNAHHEDWLKNNSGNADTIARFDSIWSQVSRRFAKKSDHLLFEILNEPNPMPETNLDNINAGVLAIIRKTNPTRIVIFSGNVYSNSDQLVQAAIPDPNDKYLMGYYHSYDPWSFAGQATGTYGTTADINATIAKFDQVSNWSATHHIPVVLDEFGAIKECDYNSRMLYYATVVEQALRHGIAFNAWDDNGDFQIYNRTNRTWNDLKDILIHYYKESPDQLSVTGDTSQVTLSWADRTSYTDSIIIDRRTNGTDFTQIGKVPYNAIRYADSTVQKQVTYYYRLRTNLKDSIYPYSYPIMFAVPGPRKPYLGDPATIPGTIQAENFDLGGLNVGYYNSSNTNQGGAYRPDEGVGIESRADGGYQLDYVSDGEWLSYTVRCTRKALYRIDTYTASQNGGGSYFFKIDSTTTQPVTVPSTGDWTTLAVSKTYGLTLDTGIHILYFYIKQGTNYPYNIDKFIFTVDSTTAVKRVSGSNEDFKIGPNPTHSSIMISNHTDSQAQLEIFNMSGSMIRKQTLNQGMNIISLDGLSEGTYIFTINSNNYTFTKKIILK